QSSRPDLLKAEACALEQILVPEDHLSCIQKGNIFLVVSASNLNTYWVAVYSQILEAMGVSAETSEEILKDAGASTILKADRVVLDETRKLASLTVRGDRPFG